MDTNPSTLRPSDFDDRASQSRRSMRRSLPIALRSAFLAQMASAAAAPFVPRTFTPRASGPVTSLRTTGSAGSKYPGQHTRYLTGASRPMTDAEIHAHNAAVAKERAA